MSLPWFPDSTTRQSQTQTRRRTTTPSSYHLRPSTTIPPPSLPPRRRANQLEKEVISQEDEKEKAKESESYVVEAEGVDIPAAVTSFEEMGFSTNALSDNIRRCKYVKPTPIQSHAIPVAMRGRDLMACAHTGSGKTAAFCFPIINAILLAKQKQMHNHPTSNMACPMALILAPTRELTCQIHEEAKKFSYQTGLKVVVVYGGAPILQQLQNLGKGVDILVATPGRLVDLIERSKISLTNVKYLALDEADRMLDMGFERQVRRIVQQLNMPPPGTRQTMLFSATFPPEIRRLASDFLSNYIFIAAGKVGSSADLIVQRVEFVPDINKREYLVNLLSQNVHRTHAKDALTLVFVETKRGADALERWLCRKGYPSTAIHGDKVQVERERALRSFRSGRAPILVATDVAARGLDIPHVAHVINFDLPRVVDDYVHRIGRTGRAGKSGLATAFFSDKNIPLAKPLVELMQEANQPVPSWLSEYAKIPYNRRKSRDHSYTSGRDYKDWQNNEYSNQRADMAAYAADPYTLSASADAYDPYGASSGPVTWNFPYVADSYNCECYYGPVSASGWD